MSINEPVRQKLFVVLWLSERKHGVVRDRQEIQYEVHVGDLAPGTTELHERDIVSGIIEGPDCVRDIQIERFASGERAKFESVGPAPEVKGWDPNRGTPGIGHIRLGK